MKKLLVLGGGQLARYLVHESHSLPIEVHTVSDHSDDPAAQINPRHHVIHIGENQKFKKLLDEVDLITFESEFFDSEMLANVAQKNKSKFYPSLDNLSRLQDRSTQKETLFKYKVPTLPYMEIKDKEELELKYDKKLAEYENATTQKEITKRNRIRNKYEKKLLKANDKIEKRDIIDDKLKDHLTKHAKSFKSFIDNN